MSDIQVEFSGIDELEESLKAAIRLNTDLAEEKLEKTAKEFKRRVVKVTKELTTKRTGKLLKGYKLSKVLGYGSEIHVHFYGTAPHFHLVENGHELVKNGQNIGWVPGKGMVNQVRGEYEEKMPGIMLELLEDIIKESGLDG